MDTDAIYSAIASRIVSSKRGDHVEAEFYQDEIKRLMNEADEEHKSLIADNERLVDEVAELKAAYESQFKELHTLKTENERLVDEVAEARKEISEQARLNGMGAEREALLMAERDALKAELEDAKQAAKTWENEAERRSDRYTKCAAELERIKALEPVAWGLLHSKGLEFGSAYAPQKTKEAAEEMARQHMGDVTVAALYALGSKT